MNLSSPSLWLVALAVAVLVVFLPRYGLLAWWRAARASSRRERLEDALKILLSHEQAGRHASAEVIAAALELRLPSTLRLMEAMEQQGLVEGRTDGLHLTAQGERWALQVVRAHRLWERYLAAEARLPLERVHREANRKEHTLTPAEVDDLDAFLGYPERDPHGDPIPSRDGRLPPGQPTPLTEWPQDSLGIIVHLEDEPPIAYAQLLAEGVHLGQAVRVLESTPERVVFSDGLREVRLAPIVAGNIHLAPAPVAVQDQRGVVTLADLPDQALAEVVAIDDRLQGYTRRRLLDLGMTPGANIKAEMRNFLGDPRAYRIRGTLIALRREQADQVWVRPVAST